MFKLYKYRPLNDLLFKELHYSELYFASYNELNDPLDLSVRIDYNPSDQDDIEYLIYFLVKTTSIRRINEEYKLIDFFKDKQRFKNFCSTLFEQIHSNNVDNKFLAFEDIEEQIIALSIEYDIKFNINAFNIKIQKLSKIFFENSYTCCFSESSSDFLMWSHYASKHSGICLEFSLPKEGSFPFVLKFNRKVLEEIPRERSTELEQKEVLYWDKIHKIEYKDTPPSINFYEFSQLYENEGDIDLMKLSKSRWHGYAAELEKLYSKKTSPWHYELEWRTIQINFDKAEDPEQRIHYYPIEALTGIYFGFRTPELAKNRIYNLLKSKNSSICFYCAQLTNNSHMVFNVWEPDEE